MSREDAPTTPGRISRRAVLAGAGGAQAAALAGRIEAVAQVGFDDDGLPFRFEEITDDVGIDYRTTGEGISNTCAGIYVDDFDDDGREDVLLVGGERPALYENVGEGFEESDALPSVDELRVEWPGRTEQTFEDFAADRRVRISPAGDPQVVEP